MEVVPVDDLAGPLPQRHEVYAHGFGGVRRAEEVEEGSPDGVPWRGQRTLVDRGCEVVPQHGVAIERRRKDAGGGRRCHGCVDVGAAYAIEAREMGVGALAGVAAEDG